MSANTVTETVLYEYAGTWSLDAFLKLIAAAVDNVPAEHRASAKVMLNGDPGNAMFEIFYERPLTPEQIAANEVIRERSEKREEDAERETLRRLRAKYGDTE